MLDLSHGAALSPKSSSLNHAVCLLPQSVAFADDSEVYVRDKTAGALEPNSMTGGNVYKMFDFFPQFLLVD